VAGGIRVNGSGERKLRLKFQELCADFHRPLFLEQKHTGQTAYTTNIPTSMGLFSSHFRRVF